jgi:acetolactate synthase I/II/III large subunit
LRRHHPGVRRNRAEGDGRPPQPRITNTDVGTTLKDPNIDYAAVAKGFGVHGEGPISDPAELAPALERAIAMVKSGQPALVDVVSEPR